MAVAQEHPPQTNGGGRDFQPPNTNISSSKRQRRPSVRLVEIGDQPAASASASASLTKLWKPTLNNKVSKVRPLTNLVEKESGDLDNLAIGSWKIKGSKPKRESKRPRLNWVSNKIENLSGHDIDNDDYDGNNVGEQGFSRELELEGSENGMKEQNPLQDSLGNVKDFNFDDDNGGNSARRYGGEGDGIRVWLDELGLSRYWPVFEFHEVDEEVLPWITLDDLKDMGISAVGSRRKIFCAIQKLNKGDS